jgi:hypothetical protein
MNISKLFAGQNVFKTASLGILVSVTAGVSAQSAGTCQALVQIQGDLWLFAQNGAPMLQLTKDKQLKYAAGISSDGKRIAYSGDGTGNNVTLIDATGGFLANIDPQTSDSIVGINWVNPHLLRIAEHASPLNSVFHFVKLPDDAPSTKPINQLVTAKGSSCTLSPKHKLAACVFGNIEVNGQTVYKSSDPLASAAELQNVNLVAGGSPVTLTDPPFNLLVKDIPGDTIGLQVTGSGDFLYRQYVSDGDTMRVSMPNDDESSNPAPVYGFIPKVMDKKKRIVNVRILKGQAGSTSFEGDIGWDHHGRRIAAVEVDGLGRRSVVLIKNNRSDSDNDDDDKDKGKNVFLGRIPLSIAGPIVSVTFTSPTHIRVVGASEVLDQDIPVQGPVSATGAPTVTAALPQKILISGAPLGSSVPVFGWSCK